MEIKSFSPAFTRRIARLFAKSVIASKTKKTSACVVILSGNLGSGKTTFVKAFAEELGVRSILSPTFVILKKYRIRKKAYKVFIHVDAYRIKRESELRALGFESELKNPKNIVMVEWGERFKKAVPKKSVCFSFLHGRQHNERTIRVSQT